MSKTVGDSKPKNTIIKDALILALITLVAGLAVGLAHDITRPIIDQRYLDEKKETYQIVYTDAENFATDEELSENAQTAAEELFIPNDLNNIIINEVLIAQDSSGNTLGHVVSVTSSNGYGGDLTISLGYSLDGTVQGLEFLVLNETVGFGQNAKEPAFKDQFVGRQVDSFVATKSGASLENEIDGLSGATVTTNAVTEAVNAGILFLNDNVSGSN